MIPVILSVLSGAAVGLAVWAGRGYLAERIRRDVQWLEHSAWRLSPKAVDGRKYVGMWYVAMFAVMLPLAVLVFPVPIIGLGLWLAVWLVPQQVFQRKWARRRTRIEAQLPAMARRLAAAVGAGLSQAEAIGQLADEAPEPICHEFQIMARQWELGNDMNTCLDEAARRLELPNFRMFASALILNSRMGGNLVQTMERLAASLESIAEMRQEVKAATAEGRANIKVLLIAPFLMLVIITFIDRKSVVELLTTLTGWLFLLPAAVLTAIGYLWARSMMKRSL